MDTDRRRVLSGATVLAATALGIGAGSTVLADEHDIPVAIVEVNAEAETVVLENQGSSQVDISGYHIDWEHKNDQKNQTDPLPDGTTIEAGGTLVIASGYESSEGDVTYEYENGRLNNEEPDVVALLTSGESEVVTTSEEDTSTPTETATATATETPEETATETPEETDTETPEETPETAEDGTEDEGGPTEEPGTTDETETEGAVEEDGC